ncbi:hypothetical protein G6F46_014890 [Rhizopus delemar]|nr:hypothetical protein G6F46_014890 [Rhizopus delemar]
MTLPSRSRASSDASRSKKASGNAEPALPDAWMGDAIAADVASGEPFAVALFAETHGDLAVRRHRDGAAHQRGIFRDQLAPLGIGVRGLAVFGQPPTFSDHAFSVAAGTGSSR